MSNTLEFRRFNGIFVEHSVENSMSKSENRNKFIYNTNQMEIEFAICAVFEMFVHL